MTANLTLLALPGTLCAPLVFDALTRQLAGELTVQPFSWLTQPGPWDIPAVADRVARHLEQRNLGPALVLGHSTGGAIALQLAVTRPDLVAGLLLVNTGAHMRGHGDVASIIDRVAHGYSDDLIAAVLDRSFATPLAPELRTELLSWAAAVDPAAVLAVLSSQSQLDLSPELAGLTCPVTVVHGRQDRSRTVEQAQELAGSFADAELRWSTAGHTPVHEDPILVADAARSLAARAGTRAVVK